LNASTGTAQHRVWLAGMISRLSPQDYLDRPDSDSTRHFAEDALGGKAAGMFIIYVRWT